MTLFLGLIFGAIGTVYLFLGRKDHDAFYFVTGVALIVFPYFVSNIFLMLLIGAALSALPIAHKRGVI